MMTIDEVQLRVEPNERNPQVLWGEIHRLCAMIKGPDEYETWRDAAVDQKVKRLEHEREIKTLRATIADLIDNPIQQMAPVGDAVNLPGTDGGFTMAVFSKYDVPVGTKLYTKKAYMAEWISCEDRMPPAETDVLAVVHGKIRVAALFWEHPHYEDYYQSFLYWDDPEDDGQCWEHHDVTHWMPLPELPPIKEDTE